MITPRKHADLIIAWAKGAEIEVLREHGWCQCDMPQWHPAIEYRLKPEKRWVRNYEYWLSAGKVTFVVGCCTNEEHESNLNIEPYFKRWITDRIYYE